MKASRNNAIGMNKKEEIIRENINTVRFRIRNACQVSNRNPDEVRLQLVTKTVDLDSIRIAINEGEFLVGENKVQELKTKAPFLKKLNPEIHFIGHLQSNKIAETLKWVSCVQTIDRFSLADKIHRRLSKENRSLDIYVQVNTSYEESKFGVEPEHALTLIKKISFLGTLVIKGLMTIGAHTRHEKTVRRCFKQLRQIQSKAKELALPRVHVDELSMGMSEDMECAIEEGSTMVRVGSAIFGQRSYSHNQK